MQPDDEKAQRSREHRARYARIKADPDQLARIRAYRVSYWREKTGTPEGRAAIRKRWRSYYERRRTFVLLRYLISRPTMRPTKKGTARMRSQQTEALRTLSAAIIEAIDAAGPAGAPSGAVYAGLMAQGCTLDQYEQITDGLTRAGLIQRAGHLLTATDKGREFARAIK